MHISADTDRDQHELFRAVVHISGRVHFGSDWVSQANVSG